MLIHLENIEKKKKTTWGSMPKWKHNWNKWKQLRFTKYIEHIASYCFQAILRNVP